MNASIRAAALIVAAALAMPICAQADGAPLKSAKDVKWGAPPPVFPPGAQFALIAGDPARVTSRRRHDRPIGRRTHLQR